MLENFKQIHHIAVQKEKIYSVGRAVHLSCVYTYTFPEAEEGKKKNTKVKRYCFWNITDDNLSMYQMK